MTVYYWLDGQEHSLCPARHIYLATPLRTSEVMVLTSDIGRVANTLQKWVEANNLTHWLTIADWLVERHLHLATLHERYTCEDSLTTIKRAHRHLDALAERLGAVTTHATFNVAPTHHLVTRDHAKCDVATSTAVLALPASPSLMSEKLTKPEHPRHIKNDAPLLDRKNWPQKPVGESVGVKEAEERRREERRSERKVREWTQGNQEQEWMPCKHDDARGTPAPSPPTVLPPRTHLTERPTMPMAPMHSHAMPLRHSARMPTAPMMQDADDVPTTSPAPGAHDHNSAAPTHMSTAPQCSCTTAPAVAAAQDANDAPATSPARGAQARDSLMPTCLAIQATDCPTAQVAPAEVATDTPSTPRVRHASAMTREHTALPTHPVTASPMHCAMSPVRGVHVHDNATPVCLEVRPAVLAMNHPTAPTDSSAPPQCSCTMEPAMAEVQQVDDLPTMLPTPGAHQDSVMTRQHPAPLAHPAIVLTMPPPPSPTTHSTFDIHNGPPPLSCTIEQLTSMASADCDAALQHRIQDTPETAAAVHDGAQLLPHPPSSTLLTPLSSVSPLQSP
ncbi:hypothetical protein BKA93DRAFT_830305 [Sparassis latifolia]